MTRGRNKEMSRIGIVTALAVVALGGSAALAQETVKIGMVLPLTGGQASVGKQIQAAAKLYMEKNGATVAVKKLDLMIRDDATSPDNSKRLAQELIVKDKV